MAKSTIVDFLIKLNSLDKILIQSEVRDCSIIATVSNFLDGYPMPYFDIDLTKERVCFYGKPSSEEHREILFQLIGFVKERGYDVIDSEKYLGNS